MKVYFNGNFIVLYKHSLQAHTHTHININLVLLL